MKKIMIFLAFFLVPWYLYAIPKENNSNPLGCKDVGYEFNLRTIKLMPQDIGDRQSLYFIFNKRSEKVTLYQMRKEDSTRSLYLNHTIQAGKWAVLSTNEPEVRYICAITDVKKQEKLVDCAESVKICEYARVKYGLNNKGSYWLADSTTRNGAVHSVVYYGIIPR